MAPQSGVPVHTPAKTPGSRKKSGLLSTGKQQTILGFFSRFSSGGVDVPVSSSKSTPARKDSSSSACLQETSSNVLPGSKRGTANITPAPSSDPAGPLSSQENRKAIVAKVSQSLPSPVTPAEALVKQSRGTAMVMASSSPTRKARQPIGLSPAPLLASSG